MKTMTGVACINLVLAAVLSLAPSEGAAQVTCNQRDNVLGHLARKYQEVPVAIGVTNRGGLVEVLSTGDGKTWTIIISTPPARAGARSRRPPARRTRRPETAPGPARAGRGNRKTRIEPGRSSPGRARQPP